MARKTKAQRELAAKVQSVYNRYFDDVMIGMTDIPEVYAAIEGAIATDTVESVLPGLVQKYAI